jgi:O-antigen/teichoic acid export membrane protein
MDKGKRAPGRERKLIQGTAIYFIGNMSTSLLQFLFVPFVTSLLSPDDYAYYDLAYNLILLLIPVFTLQIIEGLFRFLMDAPPARRMGIVSTSGAVALIGTGAFGLVLLILWQVTDFIRFPLWIFLYYAGFAAYQFLQRMARCQGKNRLFVLMSVFQVVVVLGLQLVLLLHFSLGVRAMFIAGAVSYLAAASIYLLQLKFGQNFSPRAVSAPMSGELLRYAMPLIPGAVCWWAVGQANRYVMLSALGMSEIGIYNMAYKFSFIITAMTYVFQLAWQESAIREQGAADTKAYYNHIFSGYMRLLLSIVLVLIPLTPLLVSLMLKKEYAAGAQFIPWIYLIAVFEGLTNFMAAGYIVSKRTAGNSITALLGAAFSVLFTLVFLRSIGVYAAILGSMLAFMLTWLLRVWHLRGIMGVRVEWGWFLLLLGLVGGFIAGYTYLPGQALWALLPVGLGLFLWINWPVLRTIFDAIFHGAAKDTNSTES